MGVAVAAGVVGLAIAWACDPNPGDPSASGWSPADWHGCKGYVYVRNWEPDAGDDWYPAGPGYYKMCSEHQWGFDAPYEEHRWGEVIYQWVDETQSPYRHAETPPYESDWYGGRSYMSQFEQMWWAAPLGTWAPTTVETVAKTRTPATRPKTVDFCIQMKNTAINLKQ